MKEYKTTLAHRKADKKYKDKHKLQTKIYDHKRYLKFKRARAEIKKLKSKGII